MSSRRLLPLLATVLFALSSTALYANTWEFTGSSSNVNFFANLAVTPTANPNVFDVTGISGNVNGNPITGLIPTTNPGVATYSPSGFFIFDNVVYANQPQLDIDGIAFYVNGTTEANIFWNPGYLYYQNNGFNQYLDKVSITTPEPASVALLGSGLLGLGLAFGKRLRLQ